MVRRHRLLTEWFRPNVALRWAERGVALTVSLSALALGGAHTWVVLAGVLLVVLCCVAARAAGSLRDIPPPAVVLALLGVYTLIQSVPVPVQLLEKLSPAAADAWKYSLSPFGEAVAFGSLSLDPGASSVEAAKWLAYAAVFCMAAAHARRRGASAGILVVFVSALAVALATLGHGLAGTSRVFGLYEPSFAVPRWHMGPMLNPNCLAGYLVLGVFCGAGLALDRAVRVPRALLSVGLAVMIGVAVLSGSRGGVAVLLCGVLVFSAAALRVQFAANEAGKLRWFEWLGLASPLILGLGFAVVGADGAAVSDLFRRDVDKLRMWRWVVPLLEDFPLFGVGRGAFETGFPPYKQAPNSLVYSHPENFVIQWLSEWGFLVGLGGLLSLAWLLKPTRLGFGRRMTETGALVGVGALLLQNFVDLGLELFGPALAVTVALGTCWGSAAFASKQSKPDRWTRSAVAGSVLFCLLLLSVGSAFARGRASVGMDRSRLHARYIALDLKDTGAVSAMMAHVREAIRRHPGEPYFPRLSAAIALRAGSGDALRWANRALERCPADGATHLLVARALVRRGALSQALIEARLAAELDPAFSGVVGSAVVRWSANRESILRVAPPGKRGAAVLLAAALQLQQSTDGALREELLREAIVRDPSVARAHVALADHLIRSFGRERCSGSLAAGCQGDALAAARKVDRLSPEKAVGVELISRVYAATQQLDQAEVLLNQRCPNLELHEGARCWRALFLATAQDQSNKVRLIRATGRYVTAACTAGPECDGALLEAGDAMTRINEALLALDYYQQAATRAPTVRTLLKVADAATLLGRVTTAQRALTVAAGQARSDSRATQQIARRREALYRATLLGTDRPSDP